MISLRCCAGHWYDCPRRRRSPPPRGKISPSLLLGALGQRGLICRIVGWGVPKILIVEDNEMNRDMLSRRLARRGYQIVLAVDGGEGIAAATAERPDLVLMDMSLPVVDGWEATRRLKAEPLTRAIPIIGLTAHAMAGDREKVIEVGCDDYDTKPVELTRLLQKIEALLARAGERS